ncbi:MAG: carboxymuconolactone decarboxylase family protein, partial [Pseudomonadota bacterium]
EIEEFDATDKLVVEYAIAVSEDFHRVRDSMMARLRAHFDEPQIVELTWRIALCGAFNRFNDVLQTEVDETIETLEQRAIA